MGVFSLAAALTWSAGSLGVTRVLTGIGLGGEVPIAAALFSEYVQARRRGLITMLWETSFIWGFLVTPLVALGLISALGAWLPESIRGQVRSGARAGHRVVAQQTAEAVADAVGGSVTLDDRLGEGVELEMLDALADEFAAVESPGRLLLVGHDPDFSTVAAALCGAPSLQLSKGAVARIDLDGRPKPGAGRLRLLIPPDALAPPS
jgi:hypothetical protein